MAWAGESPRGWPQTLGESATLTRFEAPLPVSSRNKSGTPSRHSARGVAQSPCSLLAAQGAPREDQWARGGVRPTHLGVRCATLCPWLCLVPFFFLPKPRLVDSVPALLDAPCPSRPHPGCGPRLWRGAPTHTHPHTHTPTHTHPAPPSLSSSPPPFRPGAGSSAPKGGGGVGTAWPRPRSRLFLEPLLEALRRPPSLPPRVREAPVPRSTPLRLRHAALRASAAANAGARPPRRHPEPRPRAPASPRPAPVPMARDPVPRPPRPRRPQAPAPLPSRAPLSRCLSVSALRTPSIPPSLFCLLARSLALRDRKSTRLNSSHQI